MFNIEVRFILLISIITIYYREFFNFFFYDVPSIHDGKLNLHTCLTCKHPFHVQLYDAKKNIFYISIIIYRYTYKMHYTSASSGMMYPCLSIYVTFIFTQFFAIFQKMEIKNKIILYYHICSLFNLKIYTYIIQLLKIFYSFENYCSKKIKYQHNFDYVRSIISLLRMQFETKSLGFVCWKLATVFSFLE